ncbi:MAG: hypothetical protein ACI8W3_001340 [Myxococcota bacterium]
MQRVYEQAEALVLVDTKLEISGYLLRDAYVSWDIQKQE